MFLLKPLAAKKNPRKYFEVSEIVTRELLQS